MKCHVPSGHFLFLSLMLLTLASGCTKPPPAKQPVHVRTEVKLVKAERKTIVRTTGQPGFLEAYEQTAIYPKVSGYVAEWKVDIGDHLEKGQIIARISVPELEAEYREKKAQVALDEVQIQVAEELVQVASQNWKAATAQVEVARANVGRYQADIERWQSEVNRLDELAGERVVNQQILSESRKQLKASTAARAAAKATTVAGLATEAARKADIAKSKVDVEAARARATVSQATEQRLAALVGYTAIHAPYKGVVVARNVNTGDYVQAAGGDQTSQTTGKGKALYMVARTDIVRIFLDVPEMEANGVQAGSKATVRIQAINEEEIPATVTRTSWGLNGRTRTLRAEVDLPNPDGHILPNMYAYGQVEVKRPNVWVVPVGTVVEIGNQNCCYLYENGKAVQTPVQKGIMDNDGKMVEVARKRVKGKWAPFDGSEQIIEGDLSEISDGEPVRIADAQKE